MKKQIIAIATCLLILFQCSAFAQEFTVDADGFMQGSIEHDGFTIKIDALVEADFPSPLAEVKLTGAGFSEQTIMDAARTHFSVVPDRDTSIYPFLFSYGNGEETGWREGSFRSSFPITDEKILVKLDACYAFLETLGMEQPVSPTKAIYFLWQRPGVSHQISASQAEQEPDALMCIEIPITISGLPIISIGNRGPENVSPDKVFTDMPWASFAFNMDGELYAFTLSFYDIEATQPISGNVISWQEAIFPALEYQTKMIEQLSIPKEQFFEKYDLVITRVRSAWFDNWFNVLRPGYVISFDAFDKTTGEYVISSYNESSDRYEGYFEHEIGIEALSGSAPY